jgi:acetyl esterase
MHPIDPQLEHLLAMARSAGAPELGDVPLPIARALYSQIMSTSAAPPDGVVARDLAAAGAVPALRLYVAPQARAPQPLVLWLHGGGYVVGTLDDYDAICRRLCVDAQAAVLAVDYRLAPEHAYPAAFDDAWAALSWAVSAAGRASLGAGIDVQRLALAGDSAGATLAITTALRARDSGAAALAGLALAYPAAAGGRGGDFPSHVRHAEGPTLTLRAMRWFNSHAFGATGQAGDERGAPLHAARLSGLPPSVLMLAALDPLRDEGIALGSRLMAESGAVTLLECHGLAHGFLCQGAAVAAAAQAQRVFGHALHQLLHGDQEQ